MKAHLATFGQWLTLGSVVGVVCGAASAAFRSASHSTQ
jgi:hypothetical protein